MVGRELSNINLGSLIFHTGKLRPRQGSSLAAFLKIAKMVSARDTNKPRSKGRS